MFFFAFSFLGRYCFVVVVVGVVLPLVMFLLLLFLVVCSCGCVVVAVLLFFSFFWFCFVLFCFVCIFLRNFLKLSFCQINGNCEIFMGEDQKRKVDGKGDFRMKKIHTDKKGQLLSLYWALWRIMRA